MIIAELINILNDKQRVLVFIRYYGWQNTVSGERLLQKDLRKILMKYKSA